MEIKETATDVLTSSLLYTHAAGVGDTVNGADMIGGVSSPAVLTVELSSPIQRINSSSDSSVSLSSDSDDVDGQQDQDDVHDSCIAVIPSAAGPTSSEGALENSSFNKSCSIEDRMEVHIDVIQLESNVPGEDRFCVYEKPYERGNSVDRAFGVVDGHGGYLAADMTGKFLGTPSSNWIY
jgi:hypothetical protein